MERQIATGPEWESGVRLKPDSRWLGRSVPATYVARYDFLPQRAKSALVGDPGSSGGAGLVRGRCGCGEVFEIVRFGKFVDEKIGASGGAGPGCYGRRFPALTRPG